jgi:hypothetical protein
MMRLQGDGKLHAVPDDVPFQVTLCA